MNQNEREALVLANEWVKRDPFYAEAPTLTRREQALMALALRCYAMPEFAREELAQLPPAVTSVDDTWDCPDHGDACVTIAECAENHDRIFNYRDDED